VIGLIGGLGVGAGIHYYRELAAAHAAEGRQLDLTLVHAQMSRVFQHTSSGDLAGLAGYLAGVIGQLQAAGATVAVIPAVTPHICIDQLTPLTDLPIVNLLDAVGAEVQRRGVRRVALFGTRFVIESDFFGRLAGVEVVRPRPEEVTLISDTYVAIAGSGHATPAHHAQLTAIARRLCDDEQVEAVVLAGTDLSLVFNDTNTDFPNLDCADVHIQAIMRAIRLN
jgi:aspartate racemase